MNKQIFIYANEYLASKSTEKLLRRKLDNVGHLVQTAYNDDTDLIICVGGDGTFLEAIHKYNFPNVPIIGINTGHLGFFQEIMPNKIDDFIFNFSQDKYHIQPLSTVEAVIKTKEKTITKLGLNEISIKGDSAYSIHLNIAIDGSFIERFSGDGILVATPAGSTAYNYSLGGSIVDPRLNLLQVTPIAPMNTTAYRSFTSSILLPSELSLGIVPDLAKHKNSLTITSDGFSEILNEVEDIDIHFSPKQINLMRFENYDFWKKVKSKFL